MKNYIKSHLLFCPRVFFQLPVVLIFILFTVVHFELYGGSVTTIPVFSKSMKKDSPVTIILPEQYSDSSRRFPVLYLLHGYGGDHESWCRLYPALVEKADELGVMIICPDGGYRSWYLDSPIDTTFRYETYIIRELIPFVDSHFRTIDDRSHRAITGLSMGGHGSLFLAIRHPDLFGAAGSTSGGVDIRQYTESWDLKEKILGDTICCRQNWEEYTVINLVNQLESGALELIIDCGTEDFFIEVNRNLHRKLLRLGIAHDYTERSGEHNGAYWINSIDYHLLFFDKFFNSSTHR